MKMTLVTLVEVELTLNTTSETSNVTELEVSGSVKDISDTYLLPHAEVLFFVIIKKLPLFPQLVLRPWPGQVAGGE